MTKKSVFKALFGIVLVTSLSLTLQAEGTFKGNLLLGFRVVDTSGPGADYKYREDVNLRGGARLTNFNLAYAPDNGLKKYFDRLDVQLNNFGGDPFETFSVSLQKYGKYTMRYDRRKSAYFYQDLILGDGGALYDLHSFDFERVVDSGLAKISLGQSADLYFNFDRYTKKGRSTTTQDVERLEFEFDKPVQEESKEVAVGLNVHFSGFSFVLEQKFLNYDNENSYFLPGYSDGGENAYNPTALNYYNMNQPYNLKANFSTLRFNARPIDRLFLTGSAQFSALDMDLDYSESASGLNYLNRKFEYDYSGAGKFDRNMQLFDFNASFVMTQKLTLVGAIRFHRFDQTGSFTIDSEQESMDIAYETLGVDAGVQYEFSPQLALTLGYRFENRDLDNIETVTDDLYSTQNGGFGNLKWNPTRALKLTLDYEHSSYENPFTLISPTAYDRLRITASYQVQPFTITGSYMMKSSKSEVDANVFDMDRNQFNLRAGYQGKNVRASAGYAYIQSKRQGDRTVTYPPFWTGPGGTFLWEIFYEGKANLIDGSVSFDVNENWKLGGYVNFYDNSGSYEIKRTTFKAYLEYAFTAGYVAQFGYRYVNFEETNLGYNDYKANILEFSFGYRWK